MADQTYTALLTVKDEGGMINIEKSEQVYDSDLDEPAVVQAWRQIDWSDDAVVRITVVGGTDRVCQTMERAEAELLVL